MVDFEVVDLPATDHVDEGDRAPDFTRPLVNDEYWADASLSDLTDDGPVCLVFYPMDGAFPATYIWNELRDRALDDLLTVVGVSISTPYAHKRLIEERGMNYDLFSDPANGVAEQYGVVNDLDGMAGISEARPATFLIDEDRTVQYAWVAEEWPDFPPYDDLEAEIRALVD
ncbi:redoxin domain-containing protein [Haloplanus aerogenes]|uniref:thioredoxin-dependent peroxiredoxin n=1 Tax=Haloplanus aerogenes TaxID=660522 RepID=A0A3M0CXA2_9EURY|nr:redoxin domain-containing protein [Haloplanus aerogenes]AZH27075.1 peroxiredoxin [Haloplanus aerogenes]RMB13425.1 peroxiredoxin [Haloplanus aerogenes]